MTQKIGMCPLCGGEKKSGTTTFTVDLKFGVVVVREVPALVCSQCGEAWIGDAATEKLERVVADARRRQAVVKVTRWEQVAARPAPTGDAARPSPSTEALRWP